MAKTNEKTGAYWVIVANSATANFYTRDTRRGALQESDCLINPIAKQKLDQIVSDRSGRSFDSQGAGRHAMTNEKLGPKRQQSLVFARQIVDRVVAAKGHNECREFVLIAAPRFLGTLREVLATKPGVVAALCIDKDMVGQSAESIGSLIRKN